MNRSDTPQLKDPKDVLAYAVERGKKLGKTKLYDDIGVLLKRQPDGTFKLSNVKRYFASLPTLGSSDRVVADAEARLVEKETQEIRRIKAVADKEEFALEVKRGLYIPREDVFHELAGRAVAFSTALQSSFEGAVLDLVASVDGNPKKAPNLLLALEELKGEALNTFSQVDDFEVLIRANAESTAGEAATEGDE